MAKDYCRVSLEGGKYTYVCSADYQLSCLRYGELWMGPEDLRRGSNALMALMCRVEALEKVAAAAVEIEYILRDPKIRNSIDCFTAQPLQVALKEAEIPLIPDPVDPLGDEP